MFRALLVEVMWHSLEGPDVAHGSPDLPLDRALLVAVGSASKAGAFRHRAGGRIVHVGPELDLGQLERGERPVGEQPQRSSRHPTASGRWGDQ